MVYNVITPPSGNLTGSEADIEQYMQAKYTEPKL